MMTNLPYDGATPEQLGSPFVRELLVVHNMFRQQLQIMLQFVSELIDGDKDLSSIETQLHIRSLIRIGMQYSYMLHTHHHHERDYIFPNLQQYGLADETIQQLNHDHDVIAMLIDTFDTSVRQYSQVNPSVVDNDLRRLADALKAHLAYEETHICPFLARFSR